LKIPFDVEVDQDDRLGKTGTFPTQVLVVSQRNPPDNWQGHQKEDHQGFKKSTVLLPYGE